MEKRYILSYEKRENDDAFSALVVADPGIKLSNGKIKVVKVIIGDHADELMDELTRCTDDKEGGEE